MLRKGIVWTSIILAAGMANAISGQPAAEFEAASIKPAASGHVAVRGDASQLGFDGIRLQSLIVQAYRTRDFQVSGPDWIGSDRFDLSAK